MRPAQCGSSSARITTGASGNCNSSHPRLGSVTDVLNADPNACFGNSGVCEMALVASELAEIEQILASSDAGSQAYSELRRKYRISPGSAATRPT